MVLTARPRFSSSPFNFNQRECSGVCVLSFNHALLRDAILTIALARVWKSNKCVLCFQFILVALLVSPGTVSSSYVSPVIFIHTSDDETAEVTRYTFFTHRMMPVGEIPTKSPLSSTSSFQRGSSIPDVGGPLPSTTVSATVSSPPPSSSSSSSLATTTSSTSAEMTSGRSGHSIVGHDRLPAIVNPKEVDELLSRQLRQLKAEAHNPINEEIHGVRCLAPEETPEMVTEALRRLAEEIEVIPFNARVGYNTAQQMFGSSTYVNTTDFRLKFLRSHLFDARKAAFRIVCFLDLVLEYFGTEVLRRPLQLSDLDKDTIDCIRSGFQQILNVRDRSGRRLGVGVQNIGLHLHYRTRVSDEFLHLFFECVYGVLPAKKLGVEERCAMSMHRTVHERSAILSPSVPTSMNIAVGHGNLLLVGGYGGRRKPTEGICLCVVARTDRSNIAFCPSRSEGPLRRETNLRGVPMPSSCLPFRIP
jgi:hypothetical protein